MSPAWLQLVVGTGLAVVGCAFLVFGVRCIRRARSLPTEPLSFWEHLEYWGFASLWSGGWRGSRRGAEYLRGFYTVFGGLFGIFCGVGIVINALGR